MRFVLFMIAIGTLLAGGISVASAQDATCALPPVSLPLFDATPAAEVTEAIASPASPDDPAREATDEEAAQFRTSLELLVDCMNTHEAATIYAVFTERYLASWFVDPDGLYQPDLERVIDQNYGIDASSEPIQIVAVDNVQVREDGRMSGEVTLQSAGTSWQDILILKLEGDVWLIDDVIRITR